MSDRPLARWMGRPVEDWRTAWRLPALQIHDAVDSTNDLALRLAADGAPHGTTVLAEVQTRGRGRQGREWTAPPLSSLLLSMVFRPPNPAAEILLSLRLGLAAAQAVEDVAPLRVGLKWPNDLVVDAFKVGGILCEGGAGEDRRSHIVAGIGLNVHQTREDWPPDLRPHAASLQQLAGAPVDRAALAGQLVGEWLRAGRLDTGRLHDDELRAFRHRDVLIGREITVNGEPAGVARGIEPDGALLAGVPGAPKRIIAGTIRTRDTITEHAP